MLAQLADRAFQLLNLEIPYQTGNLKQGIAAPDIDYEQMTALLTVTGDRPGTAAARPALSAGMEKRKVP